MSIIKCKMCGGNLELTPGSTLAVCENCGRQQTVPAADDEKKLLLFERAERLRKQCEFDKAAGIYEAIVADFRQEAEGYWGLVLCRYGIEYVDDPATGEKVITCHRSSFESVLDDSDFDQTLENADPMSRRVYREEARQIEQIRQRIVEVSGKEDPYDVFICYKETDPFNQRTVDSVVAQDIYTNLTAQGYRVFFSRISLEDKLGAEYEPIIFAALNSAKIMLVVGTDYEYFNAVWVKNEWSRYLKLMAKDHTKHLVPCYKGIDPYDLPREFQALQAQDMGKVGAMQDLMRGVEKILPKKTSKIIPNMPAAPSDPAVPLLERASMFLSDGQWKDVWDYCNRVLDMQPQNGTAYYYMLLADFKCRSLNDLKIGYQPIKDHKCYSKILAFADPKIQQAVTDCSNQIQSNISRKNQLILDAKAKKNVVNKEIETATDAIKLIADTVGKIKDGIKRCETTNTDLLADINSKQKTLNSLKITGAKIVSIFFCIITLLAFFGYAYIVYLNFAEESLDSGALFIFSSVIGLISAILFVCLFFYDDGGSVIKHIIAVLLGEVVVFFIILVIVNNPLRLIDIFLSGLFGDKKDYFQPGGDLISVTILAGLNYLVAVPCCFIAIKQMITSKSSSQRIQKELGPMQAKLAWMQSEQGELAMLNKQLLENEALYKKVCAEAKANVQRLYGEFEEVAKKCGEDTTIPAPDWWNDATPANQNAQSK